jgi:hypothetical protein
MAEVKRVEAKITLQKNDDGHWLVVDAPSGKHAMINIENVFEGGVRKTLLEWAEQTLRQPGKRNRQLQKPHSTLKVIYPFFYLFARSSALRITGLDPGTRKNQGSPNN